MRARLLHGWTAGVVLALAGMVCGLAVMAMAVSADDGGDVGDRDCPMATATPTATATQVATEQSSAAIRIAVQSTDEEGGSADCPDEDEQNEETPGNSGAAHACPFGGEGGESGESYRNHGECVSEAAHRRNEERRAARHGTPTPTGTAAPTGTPTATLSATPSGTAGAATAGPAGPGRGRPEHQDTEGQRGRGRR